MQGMGDYWRRLDHIRRDLKENEQVRELARGESSHIEEEEKNLIMYNVICIS